MRKRIYSHYFPLPLGEGWVRVCNPIHLPPLYLVRRGAGGEVAKGEVIIPHPNIFLQPLAFLPIISLSPQEEGRVGAIHNYFPLPPGEGRVRVCHS
jgi:hypothetical protein